MNFSFFIGITGASGSGKTTILNEYSRAFQEYEPSVISLDNYYHPLENQLVDENGVVNFDLPSAFDMHQFFSDLEQLRNGKEILRKEYDFNNEQANENEIRVKPSRLVFIEGLFVLENEKLRSQIDYHVYVKANQAVSFQRRLKRDLIERGIPEETIHYQWNNHVCIANEKYLFPHEGKADIIIDNSIHYHKDLQQSILEIKSRLEIIPHA